MCGLLRVQLFSRKPDFVANSSAWWCRPPAGAGDWREIAVQRCFPHSGQWLAKLAPISDRDSAAVWNGGLAAVTYDALPPTEEDEFYWCDLIGMQVENLSGELLGEVAEMMNIGAHDVLCVRTADGAQLLIPFVDKHVPRVELHARRIVVDWQRDW